MKNLILFLVTMLLGSSSFAQWAMKWDTLNTGTTKNITAMYFHTPLIGYIVGEDYLFKKTVDGGGTWVDLPAPTIGEKSGNKGHIVGIDYHKGFSFSHIDSGLYLTWEKGYYGVVTEDEGKSYNKFSYVDPNGFCSINGFKILPENKGNGYLNMITYGETCSGNPTFYNFYDGPFSFPHSDSVSTPKKAGFTAVDRDSNTTVFGSGDGYLWKVRWVTSKPVPVHIDSNYGITAVEYAGNHTWYASTSSGRYSMYISTDSGKTFSVDTNFQPSFSYPIVNDMSFLAPDSGIAVATSHGTLGEIIIRGNWDPWTKWRSVKAKHPLRVAKMFENELAFVAGDNGLMMRTGQLPPIDTTADDTSKVKNAIEHRLNLSIQIFPNPTSSKLNIVVAEYLETPVQSIVLYSQLGDRVQEFDRTTRQLDISEFESGLYYVELKIGTEYIRKKIIIE